jgi:RND family efflux transporter MFP subunit
MNVSMTRARRLVTTRPWLSSGVAVVVVGGSVAGYLLTGDSSAAADDGVITRLVSASTGTVREAVSATGTISPADEEDVSFSSSAEVTSVRVAVGDKVKNGDILGTIDRLSLKAALAQARSTLASAQATLADAESSGTATTAQLSADRAGVSTARRSVTAARNALDDATLRSPITGTVAQVNVAKGDQASGSTSPADTGSDSTGSSGDFVVIGMRKWTVSASVDDTEVGLVKKGQQAQITTGNVTGTVFGVVTSVSVLSSSSSGSATYPIDIEITGTPKGLHDGASATVQIIYHQVTNVLTVPTAAIHAASDGTSYVYVSSGGKKVRKDVTTGLASGGTTEIKSGLKSGDQVYIEIDTGSGPSGTSNGGNGNQLVQNGDFPGGGVIVPGSGEFPAGGKLPVNEGGS